MFLWLRWLPELSVQPFVPGSHPAMDFLNTRPTPRGAPIEPNRRRDVVCRVARRSAAAAVHDRIEAQASLRRSGAGRGCRPSQRLREWARDWIARWRDAPGSAYGAELRRLNHLLARAECYPEMVMTKDGFQVTERWRIESADELIAVVAAQIGSLFATEQPAFVKRCAGPGCTLVVCRSHESAQPSVLQRNGVREPGESCGVPRTSTRYCRRFVAAGS